MPRYYTGTGRYESEDVRADFNASICDYIAPDEDQSRDVAGIEIVALIVCGVDFMPEWSRLSDRAKDAFMALADNVEWERE